MNATTCRSAFQAHNEMQAGAAALHAFEAERANWIAVLAQRDARREVRRANKRPQPSVFSRLLSVLF